MEFIQIYDEGVAQYAYMIGSDATREAILIDPQREIERYLKIAEEKNLNIIAVAETHIHADFLTGTHEFLHRTDARAYLSAHGKDEGWDYAWVEQSHGGKHNVQFVTHGDRIQIGDIKIDVLHTPGHTPEHITFLITEGDAAQPMGAVTGDFVFVGDLGRPDLLERAAKQAGTMQKGAEALYKTTKDFMNQPDSLQIWPCHGAGSACGKSLGSMPHSSWGYEKLTSPALQKQEEQDFISYITSAQIEPPLYFARMKHTNNKSAKLLENRLQLAPVSSQELAVLLRENKDILVVDTREDRLLAMQTHLKDALYAPFPSLSMAVGSMIEDAAQKILLIVEADKAEEAHRRLINIGYDGVIGYVEPKTLQLYLQAGGEAFPIPVTDFSGLNADELKEGEHIVDVRSSGEFEAGHLKGAILAPYTRLPEFLNRLPSRGKLYVHCGSGARASVAVSYLQRLGHNAVLVNDGFGSVKSCALSEKLCA